MLSKNVKRIIKQLSPNDIVLDIGGWSCPFNRANYVIDIMPYETRSVHGYQGPKKESFSKKSWIKHDVSSSKKLPFKNKEIDFVVCSHILEDIRDPINLCSEIIRIGKRGYIEVPSRTAESIMGINGNKFAGYLHHRWLIEIVDNKIIFRFKYHQIHSSWKFFIPKSYSKSLSEEKLVSYLFWANSFEYEELIQISGLKITSELEEFIKKKEIYPAYYYSIDKLINARPFLKKVLLKNPRLKKISEQIFGDVVTLGIKDELIWNDVQEFHSK